MDSKTAQQKQPLTERDLADIQFIARSHGFKRRWNEAEILLIAAPELAAENEQVRGGIERLRERCRVELDDVAEACSHTEGACHCCDPVYRAIEKAHAGIASVEKGEPK